MKLLPENEPDPIESHMLIQKATEDRAIKEQREFLNEEEVKSDGNNQNGEFHQDRDAII